MDSEVIKNEEGVTSERWFVTDAGKHAMQLYEIKLEQDRQKAEAEAECRRIREVQKQQQVAIEKETLELMDQYFKHLMELDAKLKEEWKHISTLGAKGNIDQYKWARMIALAKERNGLRESSYARRYQDPDW
jgi:signal transduction protein with GAF and PtsI domain